MLLTAWLPVVREFPITSVRRATPSTRILRVSTGGSRFDYVAGQAVLLRPVDTDVFVPYSIASAPEDTASDGHLEFLVKLHAQDSWGEGFAPPRRGQRLAIKGPLGRFTFPASPSARRFLFIAGGTGIAPIRSMIRHVRSARSGDVRLLYSARTPLDFAYRRELCGMAQRHEMTLTLTVTRDITGAWRGERGRITQAQLAALVEDEKPLCFVCGPSAMVEDVPRMLMEIGIEAGRIRIESR